MRHILIKMNLNGKNTYLKENECKLHGEGQENLIYLSKPLTLGPSPASAPGFQYFMESGRKWGLLCLGWQCEQVLFYLVTTRPRQLPGLTRTRGGEKWTRATRRRWQAWQRQPARLKPNVRLMGSTGPFCFSSRIGKHHGSGQFSRAFSGREVS